VPALRMFRAGATLVSVAVNTLDRNKSVRVSDQMCSVVNANCRVAIGKRICDANRPRFRHVLLVFTYGEPYDLTGLVGRVLLLVGLIIPRVSTLDMASRSGARLARRSPEVHDRRVRGKEADEWGR
jgi:hypothetical protein